MTPEQKARVSIDALLQQASKVPELKQIVPVLIFVKGIGEQKGDRMVWRIAIKGQTVTINGVDMSSLQPPGTKPR